MASLEEIRQTRLEKLELLKKNGMDPYPAETHRDFTLAEVLEKYDDLEKAGKSLTIAGRIMSLRAQGGLIFFHLFDGTAKFQGLLKKEEVEEKIWTLFEQAVDIGDFIEISGTLFVTKRGEKTVQVKNWRMLSKSLLPLPEKWHGLQDVEERFRKRYLDIIASEEVRNKFITRSKIISFVREFLNKHEYLEVETPILQHLAGGASAEPFKTHHNTLDIDLFLRIAPELYLKKLLIAGFPKVYELSRNFRNEGIDMTHNPEFTMLEFYEAYSDALHQRNFVEEMLRDLVQTVLGNAKITYQEHTIDFSKKFNVLTYSELLEKANVNGGAFASLEDAQKAAEAHQVKVEPGDSREKILDNIYKKACRPTIVEPTFIIEYPVDYLPLAKKAEKNPKVVDAFQLVVGGVEMVKAFSELNDPIDQRERFTQQEKNKAAGEKDAQSSDEEFLEAMEHGMPPAGGVGIGIDRLVMLLTDTRNIKEVIIFPTMRPK